MAEIVFCRDKHKYQEQMRQLWVDAFEDPKAYLDYYFGERIQSSQVMLAVEARTEELLCMMHVNPIHGVIQGKTVEFPYIVGVATRRNWQRRGLMRQCMQRVLKDLRGQGYTFVVLMAEREEYYKDFGFTTIFRQSYDVIATAPIQGPQREEKIGKIRLTPLTKEWMKPAQIFAQNYLRRNYDIFVEHDQAYLERMCREYGCQSGGVALAVEQEKVKGILFYACEQGKVIVQEYLSDLNREQLYSLLLFWLGRKPVKMLEGQPFWDSGYLPALMGRTLSGEETVLDAVKSGEQRLLFTDWV